MYDPEHLFYPNPINRYALGTKNKTLKFNPDGSLTIYLGNESPGKDKEANWLPAPSGNGFDRVGIKRNQGLGITEDLMDARSLFLTPNTTTVYGYTCLDLNGGSIVLQVPQGVLGPVDDADFRWVTDIGLTGPDAGKGGKYAECVRTDCIELQA